MISIRVSWLILQISKANARITDNNSYLINLIFFSELQPLTLTLAIIGKMGSAAAVGLITYTLWSFIQQLLEMVECD
jgi:Sec-independent protein secretion pathway component TatC